MTAILFGIDKFLEWVFPQYRTRLNERFPQEARRRFFWSVVLVFVILSGFLVWRDERLERGKVQEDLKSANREIVSLKTRSKVGVEGKINSLVQENKQLQQKVETLEKQLAPWELTENQKGQLVDALKRNKVPPGITCQLRVITPDKCEKCAGYATDVAELWHENPGWEVRSFGNYGLDVRLQGVFVPVDMEGCSSEELALVMTILDAADIKYKTMKAQGNVGSGYCAVIVGNRPQDKTGQD